MAILFLSDADKTNDWAVALAHELPDEEILIGAEAARSRATDIDCAVVWWPEPGLLARLPGLKAIFSLGAGVDHIFADPHLPEGVPIVRLIDPALTEQMTEWVVMNVLRHHRLMTDYALQQSRTAWQRHDIPRAQARRVGLMGLGVLGAAAARGLAPFGFDLAAWVNHPRKWKNGPLFVGAQEFHPFLARTDIVVCLLPLTKATQGILGARAFAGMPMGASIINGARGGHVVSADLIAALDHGQLSAATLDVFNTEPLPADDPLWRHPRITVTPHIAAVTLATTAAHEIAANIRNLRQGQPLNGVVDPARGY
ncbi:MAG: glyoxylate/hydroxypyruvate reductase A [Alphaproteobacteria bacterium]|jgi:glyoxylate/hydroxypyruvate reductase A